MSRKLGGSGLVLVFSQRLLQSGKASEKGEGGGEGLKKRLLFLFLFVLNLEKRGKTVVQFAKYYFSLLHIFVR